MRFWKRLKRFFGKPKRPSGFSLGNRGGPGIPGGREDVIDGKVKERLPFTSDEGRRYERIKRRAGPSRREPYGPGDLPPPTMSPFGGMSREDIELLSSRVHKRISDNVKVMMRLFSVPRNSDVVVRDFDIRSRSGHVKAVAFFLSGLSDGGAIEQVLLNSLMRPDVEETAGRVTVEAVRALIVPQKQAKVLGMFSEIVSEIVHGNCALFVDGDSVALVLETKKPPSRAVAESPTELVVRGPHTGFIENLEVNVGLVRAMLATPRLIAERRSLGGSSHKPVVIMYLEGVANPKLVDEIRRQLSRVRTDYVGIGGTLGYFIEQTPWNPFPLVLDTERPDRVAGMLAEGHVALVGATATAVVVPVSVWALMQSPDDYYVHAVPASLLRLVRWLALCITVYASALYIAAVSFHPSMIPTELLFSIAAARELVPFPEGLEVFLMEISFELIREAGIRIPSVIGPTIGIVGAVILGQAAVQANLVSPVLVVIVAVSGLTSFAIPNYSLGLLVRIIKFVMLLSASVLGIPGMTLTTLFLLTRLLSIRSFGVPVTAPVMPSWPHSQDTVIRGPTWRMRLRPQSVRPIDPVRQPPGRSGTEVTWPERGEKRGK